MKSFFVLLLIAWLLGIVGGVFQENILYWIPVFALVVFLIVRYIPSLQIGTAMICLATLGSVWGAAANVQTPQCSVPNPLTGTITRIYKLTDQQAQYVVTVSPDCTMLVTTNRFPEFGEGDVVSITGKAELVTDMPEELAGYAQFLQRNGIFGTNRFAELKRKGQLPSYFGAARHSLRQHISETFTEPESGVLLAMITGQRGGASERTEEQFRITGLTHILSISGFHISILVGGTLALMYLFPFSPLIRTIGVIILLWLYVFLIELQPAAVRAAIFWTATIIAFRLQVLVSLATVFLLALAAMISFSPLLIHDIGFQLSFLALAGLALILFLARRLTLQGFEQKWMLDLFLVSLGATLTTWPIIVYHFGTLSLTSIPANILAMPAVPMFLIGGIIVLLASYIFSPLALVGSFGVHLLWKWIAFVVNFFSSADMLYLENLTLSPWIISLYYALLIAVSSYILVRQGRTWREVWE